MSQDKTIEEEAAQRRSKLSSLRPGGKISGDVSRAEEGARGFGGGRRRPPRHRTLRRLLEGALPAWVSERGGVLLASVARALVFAKKRKKEKSVSLGADHAGCSSDKYQSSLISCTHTNTLMTKYRGIYVLL